MHRDLDRRFDNDRRGQRFLGERDRGRDEQVEEDLFYYIMSFGSLVAGASNLQTQQIDADADFKLMKLTKYAYLHGAAFPYSAANITELSLFLRDGSTGRGLTYQPVPLDAVAGDGREPAILPIYRVFKAKATIQATIANFSGVNQYDQIQLVLIGTKLFR